MEYRVGTPGSALEKLCRGASEEVLLVAPYIKASVLARLLASIPITIELDCVTRWRPADIMAGVSDLEVFRIVDEHGGKFWLRQDLHAKYFRGDEHVLLGSANLTSTALGWSSKPNLELLINANLKMEDLKDFENILFEAAVQVDENLYTTFRDSAKNWKLDAPPANHQDILLEEYLFSKPQLRLKSWMPACRSPADLFSIYQPSEADFLPTETLQSGNLDLAILQPPPRLTAEEFKNVIAVSLLAIPVFNVIDRFVTEPRRFGEVREHLQQELSLSYEQAGRAWQTLIRWIRYFLPERYEYKKPNYSEIIVRKS